jgi:hypothetical protein
MLKSPLKLDQLPGGTSSSHKSNIIYETVFGGQVKETMKIKGKHKTREVFIDGVLLDPAASQKIFNHSPDGFSWGSPGSGCSQLALALILRFAGSARIANRLYHDFKIEIIQHIPIDSDFEMDAELNHRLDCRKTT